MSYFSRFSFLNDCSLVQLPGSTAFPPSLEVKVYMHYFLAKRPLRPGLPLASPDTHLISAEGCSILGTTPCLPLLMPFPHLPYLRFSSILSFSLSPSALPCLHERSGAIFKWLPLGPQSSAMTTPALHYLPLSWRQDHALLMRASIIHFTGQKCFAYSAMLPSTSSLPMESLTHQ